MNITVTYRETAQQDIEIFFVFGTDMRKKIR
jgi:hypothetical protein